MNIQRSITGAVLMAAFVIGCSKQSSAPPKATVPDMSAEAQTNVPASDNPNKSQPTFLVQAYQIDGETFLPPEKLSGTLANNTGTVDMARISMEVKKLQEVYRQAGYTNVRVEIPPQRFTNGIVHLKAVKQ